MAFSFPEPAYSDERELLDAVRGQGWHAVSVHPGPREDSPLHSYTVGLQHTVGHPELVIVGLAGDTGRAILQAAVGLITAGWEFAPGDATDRIVHGFDVFFEPVHASYRHELLEYADWFYGDEPWQALQVVWPDARGRYPDEPGYDDEGAPQLLLV